MKLYLDTCVWCRPFDEEIKRILRETNALQSILKKVDKEEAEIIGSSVLLVEVSLISFKEKKESIEELSELLHPDGWRFLRVLGTREGNFRFTVGCVSQFILMGMARPPGIL